MTIPEISAALSHARGLLSQLPAIGLHTIDALHEAERICHDAEGLREENAALRARLGRDPERITADQVGTIELGPG